MLGRAIYFGVLSALVTSALLIAAFASALLGSDTAPSAPLCSSWRWRSS
jgi:hypothetical protein